MPVFANVLMELVGAIQNYVGDQNCEVPEHCVVGLPDTVKLGPTRLQIF